MKSLRLYNDHTFTVKEKNEKPHLFHEAHGKKTAIASLSWGEASWHKMSLEQETVSFYVTTYPWQQEPLPIPAEPPAQWFWLSYTGWHNQTWFDGPLAHMIKSEILSYTNGCPSLLAIADICPAPSQTTKQWERPQTRTTAACALRAYFSELPALYGKDFNKETAAVCLALAQAFYGDRITYYADTTTPKQRKFLSHLGARVSNKAVPPGAVSTGELTTLCQPFIEDILITANDLSPIIN